MLEQIECPRRLRCETNFEEWRFELYVDYTRGIIYNREELPKFFDAFNIPAGGIVYLEFVHGKTVRLFWNQVRSRLTEVRGLESQEGGSIEEYDIPEVEFECEINEQMLRAEKRLEDIDALFGQAVGKRGVFQTICEVFKGAGKVLTFDEIFKSVLGRRMVSKAAIRMELSQRACFVAVSKNSWRFEPERGGAQSVTTRPKTRATPIGAKVIEPQNRTGTRSTERPISPLSNEPKTPQEHAQSLEHELLDQARLELESLGGILQSAGISPYEKLSRLAERLITLGQRLQSDVKAFSQSDRVADEFLESLWLSVERQPAGKAVREKLSSHLWGEFIRKSRSDLLAKVHRQLAGTRAESRENLFFPLLGDLAGKALKEQQIALARELYQLLRQQGAGEFRVQLARIEQEEEVQTYIDIAQDAKEFVVRWNRWKEAWETCPQSSALRQAIQKDLDTAVAQFEHRVTAFLEQGDINNAFESCGDLMSGVGPLSDVWRNIENAHRVWRLIGRTFSAILEKARRLDRDVYTYRQALQALALLPVSELAQLSASDYFEGISEISQHFEMKSKTLAAAALIDYGLEIVKYNKQSLKEGIAYQAHDRACTLYEGMQFYDRAYYHASQISEKHLWKIGPNGTSTALRHRRFNLSQMRALHPERLQQWQFGVTNLLDDEEFERLVLGGQVKTGH